MKYDLTDKNSIYSYAKDLEGKSFRNLCDAYYSVNEDFYSMRAEDAVESYVNIKKKGSLGELVEEMYFNYKANSISKADFPEAGVELKVTPYKTNKNGSISAKERLIISMIDYMEIVNMTFFSSNAWEKIKNILLVYYEWTPEIIDKLDYIIRYVYMYSPVKEDLEIIKSDFYKIKQKVMNGEAHLLSEGDTLYLGAATKSATSKNRRKQPFSEIEAKPRAFSLKQSYMTYILHNYILADIEKNEKILKDSIDYDLENIVLKRIESEKGKTQTELIEKYFNGEKVSSKDLLSRIAFRILGVKSNNAEEFVKANIVVKSIRVEENNKMREAMSFPVFRILDLVDETWDTSSLNEFFSSTKFLFVVYKKYGEEYILKGAKFWNMSPNIIDNELKQEWTMYQEKFRSGIEFTHKNGIIYNDLPKMKNTQVIHVRPHARKSVYRINGEIYGNGNLKTDSDELPNGDRMPKQCFWLNKEYIKKQILDLL